MRLPRTPILAALWEGVLFCWIFLINGWPDVSLLTLLTLTKHSVNSSYRKAISHATLSDVWGDFFATYNCLFFICSIASPQRKVYIAGCRHNCWKGNTNWFWVSSFQRFLRAHSLPSRSIKAKALLVASEQHYSIILQTQCALCL